ncbi:MAG: MFS transporter [Jatrophihabitans sp.]|uniref:MFS transporter n=1 Tax=Jatrophihabitans sp. TaxID=1932789 RepID=UPI003916816B
MTALADRAPHPLRDPRPGPLLAVLLLGQFMAILDVSIVNVAAPTLRTDLGASGAELQLGIAGYTISYAVLLITGARLGDRIGHGRAFRAGLSVFTLASLLCGLAPTIGTLIAFRLVQGVGAALMMPQIMSLIQRTFDGTARARALSLYSAVIACGAVVGQVLGGVLVSADLFGTSWRPVFLVNVPIGLVLLVLARRQLPVNRGERSRGLDPAGVITLSTAVLLLVLPLVLGHEEDWPAWCFVSLAASVVAFGLFVAVERGVAARGGAPLIASRVLRAPGLLVGAAALFVAMINYGGFLFAMALHLQAGLGQSAAHAGLGFAPMAIGFAITGLTWRMLPQRVHGPMIPAGLVVAALGYLVLAPILSGGRSGGMGMAADLFVVGLALGIAFSPMLTVALTHVPPAHAADASGVLVTVFQLGQVLGVATLGTLYLSVENRPGAVASAHALTVTLVALAISAVVAAAFAAVLVRRPRREVANL